MGQLPQYHDVNNDGYQQEVLQIVTKYFVCDIVDFSYYTDLNHFSFNLYYFIFFCGFRFLVLVLLIIMLRKKILMILLENLRKVFRTDDVLPQLMYYKLEDLI